MMAAIVLLLPFSSFPLGELPSLNARLVPDKR
jgi:hypothetical protein